MTSKQRLIAAIENKKPDRLPVTTHHLMKYFLDRCMNGISSHEFFDYFGMDPILWIAPCLPNGARSEYFDLDRIVSDQWRIKAQQVDQSSVRYKIITPQMTLSMVLQSNAHTTWISEQLIKEKADIEIINRYMTFPLCDVEQVNQAAENFAGKGMVRGHVLGFDIYGQPGCWQDACCLYGTQKLIMATYDDPQWVHQFLRILQRRKLAFVESMQAARFDILELGGGDASTTVISPKIFNEFVAPYDSVLIEAAHRVGQRIVYHTCGGMMPILEDIAAIKPDAMETFTPPGMGGDVNLAQAKKTIGDKVCIIGGFDQYHHFWNCSPEKTRAEVRRCFEQAGENGGFILCPSDHFFDADVELIAAYADEARRCVY